MKNKKVYLIFFFLLLYIIVQSCWWMYNLHDLSAQLYSDSELQRKKWMIIGEGSVFLVLLIISFWITLRTIKKELQLSQQQKNFLMSVTHELKTPIASTKLYLQTLLKRQLDQNKQEEIIRKSLVDTERLNQLVEGILTATQIDEQGYELHPEKINLSELLRDQAFKFMERGEKIVHFEFFIQDDITITGDKMAFESIADNLISNAIKYSPSDSTITITAIEEPGNISFSVKDEGPGIPNREKESIFQKFYRLGDENTRNEKGTGLGLYICKYLVEAHQGKISVERNSPKGAIFVCKFDH